MTNSLLKTAVDISPKAVEMAAGGAELNGQPWLAEILRELSRSLTASEKLLRDMLPALGNEYADAACWSDFTRRINDLLGETK